ncbi:hypothetical protein HK101_006745 [Irineochytrium annulatum]|nr:hypothetical protein HK101_006745 [Irineochytrium annulatum]
MSARSSSAKSVSTPTICGVPAGNGAGESRASADRTRSSDRRVDDFAALLAGSETYQMWFTRTFSASVATSTGVGWARRDGYAERSVRSWGLSVLSSVPRACRVMRSYQTYPRHRAGTPPPTLCADRALSVAVAVGNNSALAAPVSQLKLNSGATPTRAGTPPPATMTAGLTLLASTVISVARAFHRPSRRSSASDCGDVAGRPVMKPCRSARE